MSVTFFVLILQESRVFFLVLCHCKHSCYKPGQFCNLIQIWHNGILVLFDLIQLWTTSNSVLSSGEIVNEACLSAAVLNRRKCFFPGIDLHIFFIYE